MIAALIFVALASPDYAAPARVEMIDGALEAVRAAGARGVAELEDAVGAEARDRCGSSPALACLIDAAAAVCEAREPAARPACRLVADVVVTNRAAETARIGAGQRYQLMGSPDGYRAAMRRALRLRYARLAAELAVAPELTADLGASIDRFCARRARVTALAWQRCVAALVYYVGTQ